MLLFKNHWFKFCEAESKKMMKNFDPTKFLEEGGQGRHLGRI